MRSPFFLGACLALAFLALVSAARTRPREFDPASHSRRWISRDRLAADVERLASPDLRGRGEVEGGAALAAYWIEQRFHEIGLQTERLPFTFSFRDLAPETALKGPGGELSCGPGFAPLSWSGQGVAEGPVVLGPSGFEPSLNFYAGKIAVVSVGAAPGMYRTLHPPLIERALALQDAGATGVLFLSAPEDPEAGGEAAWPAHLSAYAEAGIAKEPVEARAWFRRRSACGSQARAPRPSGWLRIPAAIVFPAGRQAVFGRPDPVDGLQVRLTVRITETPVHGQNILAILPGAGADDHLVLISAHYDSHGIQPPSRDYPGGRVFPGACDNGSGVAVLLAVAEAFHRAPTPPPRGILFAAFGGEELGLQGSRVFAATDRRVREGRITADINVDMTGRGAVEEAYVVGATHSPRLADFAADGLARAGLTVKTSIDFSFPHGSDHWPLDQAGVPAVLVTCSRFAERDRPEDVPDLVNAEKMFRMAAGVFTAAWRVSALSDRFPPPMQIWTPFPERK